MRYAALTAAVFGGAMFLVPGSPASITDGQNIQNIINKSAIHAAATSQSTARRPLPKSPVALAATVPAPIAPIMVAVEPGDSLTKLAEENSTSYQRMYDANPSIENPDIIVTGQELKVPAAEEVLAPRPLPVAAPAPVVAAAPVEPVVRRSAPASSAPAVAGGSVWDQLAACESGGNWAINTGNGYYGGLQFTIASWQAVGGTGMPNEASRDEQIARGQILQARGGWGNWPACTAKLGIS